MNDENTKEPTRPDEQYEGLAEAAQAWGLKLRHMLGQDDFCTLWLAQPVEDAHAEVCLRAIPAANLHSEKANERLSRQLTSWQGLSPDRVVEVYDHGKANDFFCMLLRYMPEGSVLDQRERDTWLRDNLAKFALDFAGSLCEVHARFGAHGNLKASNVFPVRGAGVLLSDFALPLWSDELEARASHLSTRLLHPYRSPEQRENPLDCNTRSDVYAFGVILLQCLTGEAPDPDGRLPEDAAIPWPEPLAEIARQCLSVERSERFADGMELLDALVEATGPTPAAPEVPGQGSSAGGESPPIEPPAEKEPVAANLKNARAMIEKGLLEDAITLLEALPPGTEGTEELLNEIERQRREADDLASEALRLAAMGHPGAARQALAHAAELWTGSETVMALEAELGMGLQDGKPDEIPDDLREALEAGNYSVARRLLEKVLREGPATEAVRHAARQFKEGRVRKAFADNIESARRFYLLGHFGRARERWLEAARWLPEGPHRQQLRRIAEAARKRTLRLKVDELGELLTPTVEPEVQRELQEAERSQARERHRKRLWIFGAIAFVLGGWVAILLTLLGD